MMQDFNRMYVELYIFLEILNIIADKTERYTAIYDEYYTMENRERFKLPVKFL